MPDQITPPVVTPPAVTPPAVTPPTSVLNAGGEKPETWIPEKYRALGPDGKTMDLEASARKGFSALAELQKRMVDTGLPPENAEGYEITPPAGLDLAELKKDPVYASKLKGYHALGMTNKQVQQVLTDFFEVAPELASAAQENSNEAAIENLKLVWKTDADMASNVGSANRAAVTLGKAIGVSIEDIEHYGLGNNPLFIRMMAELARQTGEDRAPLQTAPSASGEWDAVNKRLRGELDGIPETDPKGRRKKLEEISQHYERRYPNRRPIMSQQSAA